MEITSYDDKKALPVGIVMEVTDAGYWHGQLWIKTGDSRWATLGGLRSEEIVPDEELAKIVAAGDFNVSPCPSDTLGFPAAYAEWNLQVLAKAAMMLSRDLSVSKDRQRVLEQRNNYAIRALQGIVEEA